MQHLGLRTPKVLVGGCACMFVCPITAVNAASMRGALAAVAVWQCFWQQSVQSLIGSIMRSHCWPTLAYAAGQHVGYTADTAEQQVVHRNSKLQDIYKTYTICK